jgi:hypothetical protein
MPTKEKFELINPKHEPLTIEKLRELSGWELSDELAEEAVLSIRKFAGVLAKMVICQNQLTECKGKDKSNL